MIFEEKKPSLILYPISEGDVYTAMQRRRIQGDNTNEELIEYCNTLIVFLNSRYVFNRDRYRYDYGNFKSIVNNIKNSIRYSKLKGSTKIRIPNPEMYDYSIRFKILSIDYTWDKKYKKNYKKYTDYNSKIYNDIIKSITNNNIPNFRVLRNSDFSIIKICDTETTVLETIKSFKYPDELKLIMELLENTINNIKIMVNNINVSISDAFIIIDAIVNYVTNICNILEICYNKKMNIFTGKLFSLAEASMIINNSLDRFKFLEFSNICENSFDLDSLDNIIIDDRNQKIRNIDAINEYINELYERSHREIYREDCYKLLNGYLVTKEDLPILLHSEPPKMSLDDCINKYSEYDYSMIRRQERSKIDLISIYADKISLSLDKEYKSIKMSLLKLKDDIMNCKNTDWESKLFKTKYKNIGIYAFEEVDYLREALLKDPYIREKNKSDIAYNMILNGDIHYESYGKILHDLEDYDKEISELMRKYFNTLIASKKFITITEDNKETKKINNNLDMPDYLLVMILHFQLKCSLISRC